MIGRKKIQINLGITNNTSLTQQVNILGSVTPVDFANVSDNLYEFNLSSENFSSVNSVSIVIYSTYNPTPITYTVAVASSNIQAVVFALNSLNQGLFSYNGTTIYVSSSYYFYGDITIGSSLFISVWNTTIVSGGSSTFNQIQLPLQTVGNYNFIVDWGDGSTDTITTWNQPETLHTYAIVGTKTLTISGIFEGFRFAGTGDRNKILSISSWGILRLGNSGLYFDGCGNLDLSAVTDVLNLTGTTTLNRAFFKCNNIQAINRINEWDVSGVTIMQNMFNNSNFDDYIGSWNVINVIRMNGMFESAQNFNQDISSWNVSNVNLMDNMFLGAFAFNQDISSWNISNVTNFNGFMGLKTDLDYLATYLDAIYNKWSLLSVQPNLTIDFGTIKYTLAGQSGRNILTGAPDNWLISDGGI